MTTPPTVSVTPDRQIADMTGDAALPRKNGELVFEEAWQGRLFGLTVAMSHGARFEWRDFQRELIAEIAHAERHRDGSTYYERWLAALERLLTAKGLVRRNEFERRLAEFDSGERDDAY